MDFPHGGVRTQRMIFRYSTVATVVAIFFLSQVTAQDVVNASFPKQIQMARKLPSKKNVWIIILAGQSNMAGRGVVEPQDTIPNERILTINRNNNIVLAKEPLHFYEPTRTGLDCGLSFARTLIKSVPKNVTILLVPVAVGGSSIQQWLGDSTWRDVKLLTNAKEKIDIAKRVGTFKGVLWHQGEANATAEDIPQHHERLKSIAGVFRTITDVADLPFLVAELGSFSKTPELFTQLNQQLAAFAKSDNHAALVKTGDLNHKGDFLHFDTAAQREMGIRFSTSYISNFLLGSR